MEKNTKYQNSKQVFSLMPESCEIGYAFFSKGKPVEFGEEFDYCIKVVTSKHHPLTLPLYLPCKGLTFLESFILRKTLNSIKLSTPFVLSVRLRGEGKISSLHMFSSFDENFMHSLVKNITSLSKESPFLDIPHSEYFTIDTLPYFLKSFLETYKEGLGESEVSSFNDILSWLLVKAGLARLSSIFEVGENKLRKNLGKEEFARIRLIRSIVRPPFNIKDRIHTLVKWENIPSLLFVFGPLLDFINLLQRRNIMKVCKNCGRLYIPYPKKEKIQAYCTRRCRKNAEAKRYYLRKIKKLRK